MRHRIIAGIILLFTLCTGPATAANFRMGGDESLNCAMTIEGPIEPGDAERFRDLLPEMFAHAGYSRMETI